MEGRQASINSLLTQSDDEDVVGACRPREELLSTTSKDVEIEIVSRRLVNGGTSVLPTSPC